MQLILKSYLLTKNSPRTNLYRQHGYWNDISHQQFFIEGLVKQLDIRDQEGWFKVTHKTIKEHGGASLMQRYKSIGKMLSTLSPEYNQMCRQVVLDIVRDLQLEKVEDILDLPLRYQHSK